MAELGTHSGDTGLNELVSVHCCPQRDKEFLRSPFENARLAVLARCGASIDPQKPLMRLDQWLWAVRIFATRTLSADAIKAGHIRINGLAAKCSRVVSPDDLITANIAPMTRTLRVLDAPPSRVGAKLVGLFALELTPPEEWDKRRPEPNLMPPGFRRKGAGRPTKRERRTIDELSD